MTRYGWGSLEVSHAAVDWPRLRLLSLVCGPSGGSAWFISRLNIGSRSALTDRLARSYPPSCAAMSTSPPARPSCTNAASRSRRSLPVSPTRRSNQRSCVLKKHHDSTARRPRSNAAIPRHSVGRSTPPVRQRAAPRSAADIRWVPLHGAGPGVVLCQRQSARSPLEEHASTGRVGTCLRCTCRGRHRRLINAELMSDMQQQLGLDQRPQIATTLDRPRPLPYRRIRQVLANPPVTPTVTGHP